MSTAKESQPLTALFSDLTRETSSLIRKEVQLAKVELSEKVSQAGNGVVSIAVGGVIAFAGLLVLLEAVVIALAEATGMSPALSALIVGLAVAVVGFVLVQKGRSDLKPGNLAPQRTVESLQKDKDFAKEQMP